MKNAEDNPVKETASKKRKKIVDYAYLAFWVFIGLTIAHYFLNDLTWIGVLGLATGCGLMLLVVVIIVMQNRE